MTTTTILDLDPTIALGLLNEKILVDELLTEMQLQKKTVDHRIRELLGNYEKAICKHFIITNKPQIRSHVNYHSILADYPNINISNYTKRKQIKILRVKIGS